MINYPFLGYIYIYILGVPTINFNSIFHSKPGWWLGKKPVLKNDGLRQLGWGQQPNIWENSTNGNQTTNQIGVSGLFFCNLEKLATNIRQQIWLVEQRIGASGYRTFFHHNWKWVCFCSHSIIPRSTKQMPLTVVFHVTFLSYLAGVGKCPFLGIGFTSPKQIFVGDEISPLQLGDVKQWDIYEPL